MVCYRQHDHTTADDARRYEPTGNRETEWKKEPINRLRHYLESIQAWDEAAEQQLQIEAAKEVEDAVAEYLAIPAAPPETMFDYLYETLPEVYADQREALKKWGAAHG